jgi:hypothetical protein
MNMNKQFNEVTFEKVTVTFFCLVSLLIAGYLNLVAPEPGAGGLSTAKGVVQVSAAVTGARTLLPDTAGLWYTLSFTRTVGAAVTPANGGSLAGSFELDAGAWTLTVTAFANQEASDTAANAVASGSAGFSVTAGGTTPVTVPLTFVTEDGAGTLSYSVTFPDSVVGEGSTASLTFTKLPDETPVTVNLLSGDNGNTLAEGAGNTLTASDSRSLDAGYYQVAVLLVNATSATRVYKTEIAHIGKGLTTALDGSAYTFAEEAFHFIPLTGDLTITGRSGADGAPLTGDTLTATNTITTGGGDPAYQWKYADADIEGATSATYGPLTAADVDKTITVTVTYLNGSKTSAATAAVLLAYTVTFNSNGGSDVSAQNVVTGGTASAPDAPTKAGYGFVHWYTTSEDTEYDFSTAVTYHIPLNAKWINLTDEDFGGESPTIQTTFTVTDATSWASALSAISGGGNDKNYVINVSGSFSVAGSTSKSFGSVTGVKVSLRGSGAITLSSNDNLLYVYLDQTLILRDIALVGKTANTAPVVFSEGALSMRSGTISGNSRNGVQLAYGTFAMSGGTISGNAYGGVSVINGTFTMSGGIISGNGGSYHGGVDVIAIESTSTGAFTKTGGIIYGNDAGANSNICTLPSGGGHAVYYAYGSSTSSTSVHRNTTLGEGDNLSTTNLGSGWGQ